MAPKQELSVGLSLGVKVDLWMGKALGKKNPALFWGLCGAMSEIYMALLSVSPTQVGIAYQLLSYWESSAWGLDLVGYNLEGSKIQVKVTRFTSQVGEFEGPAVLLAGRSWSFHGRGRPLDLQVQPKISVRNYLERIDKYFACSSLIAMVGLLLGGSPSDL